MRLMATLAAFALLTSTTFAAEAKYSLTGDNTKIEWTGTKSDGKHTGGFKKVTGTVTGGKATDLKLDLEIDCTSLYSDNEKLTGHLKSPDFFSVKEHPTAKFVSKSIEKGKKGYTVTGDLTLLGKTKEISFPAEINTDGKLTWKADFKIKRSEFGMTYGKGKVDDDVAIKVDINAKGEKK
jgi:polyisoprenoid-binding protein YceI